MDSKELRGLYEAYNEVYAPQEIDEISKELSGRVVNARIAKTGRAFDREMKDRTPENMRDTVDAVDKETRAKRLAAGVRKRRNATNEEFDIFDTILEYLVAEGYAETNESALVIMANMSEEWRQSIVVEAKVANRNPDEYEAGQQKKSAPVRGEKTPMPPRGDKRREDFEKWYAANVR